MSMRSLRVAAPAKINLHLGVYPGCDDAGYHRVDTVMATVSLADVVYIEPSDELCVTMDPPSDVSLEENSVYRAACALGHALGFNPHVAIHVEKHIPLRAGLGGPSTDAAALIKGLCQLWNIDVHDTRVLNVARAIGADVPFFLYNSPAYLSGRGDEVREIFQSLGSLPVALVGPAGPAGGVTSQAAYARFDSFPVEPQDPGAIIRAMRVGDMDAVLAHISNNLADAAMSHSPEVAQILSWLRAHDGVLAADVCGSGSTSFAICSDDAIAQRIVEEAAKKDAWWAYFAKMENQAEH
ncbi:4-(cytidine 5'-diphospho)-2-C-methyl-D-erythritol kinase [Collinsella sp. zg1085]|uniref:4-(cytidine 5'-diphospho)-2-C-methyl-D-erythritol kinase n=1 Tax=Collinsella sp. zg1085 TaxID=2844380 RepID=UPI001C0DB8CD|nr:4-(cytidine 5'-diphospho)-2-C-methyl-D-erythritol kinase [Collinsella sp. zg1085]QWT17916.1 4-(cytidine 5'-diphospho)-2-C-methyl-D-erythritol kinase [Collinsella sp. zg1085]